MAKSSADAGGAGGREPGPKASLSTYPKCEPSTPHPTLASIGRSRTFVIEKENVSSAQKPDGPEFENSPSTPSSVPTPAPRGRHIQPEDGLYDLTQSSLLTGPTAQSGPVPAPRRQRASLRASGLDDPAAEAKAAKSAGRGRGGSRRRLLRRQHAGDSSSSEAEPVRGRTLGQVLLVTEAEVHQPPSAVSATKQKALRPDGAPPSRRGSTIIVDERITPASPEDEDRKDPMEGADGDMVTVAAVGSGVRVDAEESGGCRAGPTGGSSEEGKEQNITDKDSTDVSRDEPTIVEVVQKDTGGVADDTITKQGDGSSETEAEAVVQQDGEGVARERQAGWGGGEDVTAEEGHHQDGETEGVEEEGVEEERGVEEKGDVEGNGVEGGGVDWGEKESVRAGEIEAPVTDGVVGVTEHWDGAVTLPATSDSVEGTAIVVPTPSPRATLQDDDRLQEQQQQEQQQQEQQQEQQQGWLQTYSPPLEQGEGECRDNEEEREEIQDEGERKDGVEEGEEEGGRSEEKEEEEGEVGKVREPQTQLPTSGGSGMSPEPSQDPEAARPEDRVLLVMDAATKGRLQQRITRLLQDSEHFFISEEILRRELDATLAALGAFYSTPSVDAARLRQRSETLLQRVRQLRGEVAVYADRSALLQPGSCGNLGALRPVAHPEGLGHSFGVGLARVLVESVEPARLY